MGILSQCRRFKFYNSVLTDNLPNWKPKTIQKITDIVGRNNTKYIWNDWIKIDAFNKGRPNVIQQFFGPQEF